MKKLSSGFLVAQTATALSAALINNSEVKCYAGDVTNYANYGERCIGIIGIAEYKLNIKGLEDFGVSKVNFRFGVELIGVDYHDDKGVFVMGDGSKKKKENSVRASLCANNFVFLNSKHQVIKKDGDEGLLAQAFFDTDLTKEGGISECEIATDVVDSVIAGLSGEELAVFFNDFLYSYNKQRGIGIGYDG